MQVKQKIERLEDTIKSLEKENEELIKTIAEKRAAISEISTYKQNISISLKEHQYNASWSEIYAALKDLIEEKNKYKMACEYRDNEISQENNKLWHLIRAYAKDETLKTDPFGPAFR